MTERRDRPMTTRESAGYQNKMMGDYETRGFTTAHLRRPVEPSTPKPTDKPAAPAVSVQPSAAAKPTSS